MAGALKRNQAHMEELGSLRKEEDYLHNPAARVSDSPTGGRERGEENVWNMSSHPHALIHLSLKTYFPKCRHLEIC